MDKGNIDFLLISVTKLCDSFSLGQFYIDGFDLFIRLDRDEYSWGIILYAREHIPIKLRSWEATPFERSYKKKCLTNCSYNLSKHTVAMRKILDLHSTKYKNTISWEILTWRYRTNAWLIFVKATVLEVYALDRNVFKPLKSIMHRSCTYKFTI